MRLPGMLAVGILVVSSLALAASWLPLGAQGTGREATEEGPTQVLGFVAGVDGTDSDLWHLRVALGPGTVLEPSEVESGTGHVESGTIYLTPVRGTVQVAPGLGEPITSTDGSFVCQPEAEGEVCEVPDGVQVRLNEGNEWTHVEAGLIVEIPEQDEAPEVLAVALTRPEAPPMFCGGPCPIWPPWKPIES